jgi:hypothetical protein
MAEVMFQCTQISCLNISRNGKICTAIDMHFGICFVRDVTRYFFSKIRLVIPDRLCGLVTRGPGNRSRGAGSIPVATRFSERWWVWNGVHSTLWVQMRITGIRRADYATPLYPQKLALTSPTSGGRSVCMVCSRNEATELLLLGRNSSSSGLGSRKYGHGNLLRWPRNTFHRQAAVLEFTKRLIDKSTRSRKTMFLGVQRSLRVGLTTVPQG